ncbi:DUF305 domain-containing protein [Agromyces sp. M3QZ16-3]|uniref:DUF305 domain-containing protein n=1 Tax=Agromyces sp. M3QZ16-3 TaxID=3447585 RepID=UPI003F68DD29
MAVSARSLGVAAAFTLMLGLTACTTGDDAPAPTSPVVQLGAPGEENRTLSPDEASKGVDAPGYIEADAQFMRDMIHHHDQAITMTGWVEARTDDRDVRLLAERMSISQTDELELMATWLQDRGQPVRDTGHDHGAAAMPGMLTDDELAELEAARDGEFDRLFLEYMIKHHTGAIEMVGDLYAAGGGQEQAVGDFARHVEGDQNIEIARMQTMLAERSS